MKKYICFIIVFLFSMTICSCTVAKEEQSNLNIEFELRAGKNFSLDEIQNLPYTIDEKLAFEIGDAAMRANVNQSHLDAYDKMSANVVEILGGDYYIINRIPNDGSEGGGISVAISKEDGRILKMWIGE